jgi:2-phospho-L-lactate guanylyltransferase (CobY/MobA/RfbA family)
VRGALTRARQLTRNGRVSAISASQDEVVVADARGSGSDRVELLNLGLEMRYRGE